MERDCDVCVVGAGPSGLILARELATNGLKVTVIESGGADLGLNARRLSAGKSEGYPYHQFHKARFSGIGGSTLLWTGHNRFRPLDAIDFSVRPGVPHSGWPFDLSHLVPYYERAHEILPLGPMDYSVDRWAQGDTTPPYALPGDELETAIFQASPRGDKATRAISGLTTGADFELLTETTVTELGTSEDGVRVDSALLRHTDGSRASVRARVFVLAAGGFDNPRLLLVSNRRWADGLGNTNDLVGRFFMEHPGVRSSILAPADSSLFQRSGLYRLHTVDGTLIIGTLTVAEDRMLLEGLLNSAIFLQISDDLRTSDIYRSLAMFSPRGLKSMPWPLLTYAENLANVLRHPVRALATLAGVVNTRFPRRRRVFDLRVVSEQAPNPDSRVRLGNRRDANGMPELRLDWRFTELDRWSIRRTQEILRDSLRRAGLGTLEHLYGEERPPARFHGQRHQIGTTRMHPDPNRGVVNADAKVHGIHNLFVVGSSVFPTGGHANTTLTVVAMALRLADHLESLFESRQGV